MLTGWTSTKVRVIKIDMAKENAAMQAEADAEARATRLHRRFHDNHACTALFRRCVMARHRKITESDVLQAWQDAGVQASLVRGPEPYASRAAEAWLSRFLAGGPQPAKEVYAKADANGHTEITVQRAKKALGILSRKSRGRGGTWVWAFPPKAKPSARGVLPGNRHRPPVGCPRR